MDKCLDSKCESCIHEEACNAWINHCKIVYDDFIFDVGDCPFHRSRDGRKYIALEHLQKFPIRRDHYDKEHGNEHFIFGVETVIEYAEYLPPADVVEVRHGEWIYDPNGMDWNLGAWLCSECRVKNDNLGGDKDINPYLFSGSHWCPHCGAKMGKEDPK